MRLKSKKISILADFTLNLFKNPFYKCNLQSAEIVDFVDFVRKIVDSEIKDCSVKFS